MVFKWQHMLHQRRWRSAPRRDVSRRPRTAPRRSGPRLGSSSPRRRLHRCWPACSTLPRVRCACSILAPASAPLRRPLSIERWSRAGLSTVTAVEVDRGLLEALTETLRECAQAAPSITARTVPADFVEWAASWMADSLRHQKLATSSALRRILSRTGIEVTNLYAARRVPDPARRTSKRSRCPSRTSYVPTIRTHSSASSRGIQPSQPQRE